MNQPTKTDLIHVIARIQCLIGRGMAVNHDRNPHRAAQTRGYLQRGHELCQEVVNAFPPDVRKRKNKWTDQEGDMSKEGMI